MKMRSIYRTLLALTLVLSLSAPAFAAGGETVPTPEEQPPVQTPETPDEADPEPPVWLLPPEGGEQAAEPSETPDDPEGPDGASQPETPEVPETPEPPAAPEEPSVPENPDAPENPPAPEVPVVPEDPSLPPVQPPVQLPEQVPPVVQPPVEAPVQVPQAEPSIVDVVVPDTGTVIINPYGLPVEIDGRETTEQIAGSTMLLENRSNVAVDVSVNAVGTALGGVVFAGQPPAENALEKELFLYAEFHATEAYGGAADWQGFFSGTPYQVPITWSYSTAQNVMRLEAAGLAYSWGAARLFGSVAAYPAQPWETGDGFHVNLAFTFTPVIPETPILDIPGGTDVDSTLVLPPDPAAIPDWIIPSDPVVEPDPIVSPDPIVTPDPAVLPETVPEIVLDENAASAPNIS